MYTIKHLRSCLGVLNMRFVSCSFVFQRSLYIFIYVIYLWWNQLYFHVIRFVEKIKKPLTPTGPDVYWETSKICDEVSL